MEDIVMHMGRKERRHYADVYIRGLLMDGERKSIEPMASRLPDGDIQALQQFINQSPWSYVEVRASLARKVEGELVPEAYWIIDDVSFPKKGEHSVGVARQYCGALGKTANCQVAVTLDLGTEESSTPLDWALYLPEGWVNDPTRRKRVGLPEEIVFKTKLELALDLIDEVRGWGLGDRLVLADSAYGSSYEFRQGLRSRELDYVVQVEGGMMGWTEDPHPLEPPIKKGGTIPRKRLYANELPPTQSLREIAKSLPEKSWKKVTWREGTKGPLHSRFARLIVWMANGLVQGKTMCVEPEELLIEWPETRPEPFKFWLSSLNTKTSFRGLVRKAKGRFRIEQDYREMKMEVGLDHFEGRSWQGWHHHVTLVALAYSFLMLEKLANKKNFWIDLASCPPMDPKTLIN
ncbi:MAG: IS701 family transposase, partial [Desulfobacterales bacterium]|nr:IS701 family transposase [Desulfobacterales bacterium]